MHPLNLFRAAILPTVILALGSRHIFALPNEQDCGVTLIAANNAGTAGSSSSSPMNNNPTGINPNVSSNPTSNPASFPIQSAAPNLSQQNTTPSSQSMSPRNAAPNNTGGIGINSAPGTQPTSNSSRQAKSTNPTGSNSPHFTSSQILRFQIRSALNNDGALPSNVAGGIQVITINQQVILKGTVPTQKEKQEIGAQSAKIAGENNVVNDLTVQ